MAEIDPNERMFRLLVDIDTRLREIQFKIAKDKLKSRMEDDFSFSLRNYFTDLVTLMLQINIIYWGYKYITTTTNEEIPPIAIIGTIGIAFVILNSIIRIINNSYLMLVSYKKMKRLALSLAYLMPALDRFENEFDPDKVTKENAEMLLKLKDIADDMVHRITEIGEDGQNIDEFLDELDKASSSLKDVRPVEQNP